MKDITLFIKESYSSSIDTFNKMMKYVDMELITLPELLTELFKYLDTHDELNFITQYCEDNDYFDDIDLNNTNAVKQKINSIGLENVEQDIISSSNDEGKGLLLFASKYFPTKKFNDFWDYVLKNFDFLLQ